MRCFEIVFSPTGGTKKAADILCGAIGEKLCDVIDLTDAKANAKTEDVKNVLSPEDLCIAALPVFGGRIPQVAADRLKNVCGNGALAVAVVVYGNRDFEDAALELYDILKNCGFNVIAAVTAVSEHSIMRQFAAGRPDDKDKQILKNYGHKIAEKLHSGELPTSEILYKIPGNRPYKELKIASLKPKTERVKCIGCGFCEKICPVKAISEKDFSVDEEKCIGCLRCVAYCPKKAKHVNAEKLTALTEKMGRFLKERKEPQLFI